MQGRCQAKHVDELLLLCSLSRTQKGTLKGWLQNNRHFLYLARGTINLEPHMCKMNRALVHSVGRYLTYMLSDTRARRMADACHHG